MPQVSRVSDAGLKLISEFEGFPNQGRPYNDPVGYATVGFGHLIARRRVQPADNKAVWVKGQKTPGRLTRDEALQLMAQDLRSFEDGVRRLLKREPTQSQFDALVSFAYNCGVGSLQQSTLLRLYNEGRIDQAANEFRRWCKAGGSTLPGLVRRREAERELFLRHDNPFAGFTRREIEWIKEYDELRDRAPDSPRVAELVETMTARRKELWRAAQVDGWDISNRLHRYRALKARTKDD